MTEIRIRNVDPWLVKTMHSIAKENNRSMENELKDMILRAVQKRKEKMLARLRRLRQKQFKEYGGLLPDSTPDIRAEREEW